jgi:hypothetical protein
MLCADFHIPLTKSKEPQYSLYSIDNRTAVFSIEMHNKTKSMAFEGTELFRSRILINSKFILPIIWVIVCMYCKEEKDLNTEVGQFIKFSNHAEFLCLQEKECTRQLLD